MASDARPLAPVSAAPSPKPRSCVVCRRRKVRCDKASPCANCRRANIACVFPSSADDRPPRWARRLERLTTNATPSPDTQAVQVMERLRSLEGLVKELSSQLELAHAAAGSEGGGSASSANSPLQAAGVHDTAGGTSTQASSASVQKQFGRLVLKDANRSRYISSGFWSRVDVSASTFSQSVTSHGKIACKNKQSCSGRSRVVVSYKPWRSSEMPTHASWSSDNCVTRKC